MSSRFCVALAICVGIFAASGFAAAQELQRGTIVDDVRCVKDPSQSYALYLPSNYSPDRKWSVLIGFHPAGRGRAIVEKYRAAAEQYGYVVAASNNSRNGPWEVSIAAINAMVPDLAARFALDDRRVYLTGHSGGARVALQVALSNDAVAGVIASSGGYPDSKPRAKVTFAVFGTAGTEDFNYIEMRMLDRALTSPHRLAVFGGGHTLPPDAVAIEAIEWMELQAMKTGRRSRDEAIISRLVTQRRQAIAGARDAVETLQLLDALIADFSGLRDVTADVQRAAELSRESNVRKGLARARAADDREARTIEEFAALEAALGDDSRRSDALMTLRSRLSNLSKKAESPEESIDRLQARRVLRAVSAGAAGRVKDPEYRALLEKYAVRSP